MLNRSHVTEALPKTLLCVLVVASLLGAACSSDSPTQPQQNPGPPPASSATWNVTVTADSTSLEANGEPTTLNIIVRRQDDNSPPSSGATAQINTNLGSFNPPGQEVLRSGTVSLVDGRAAVAFYPGDVGGTAIVRVTFSGDSGNTRIGISAAETNFFVESLTPNSGDPNGGETVRVRGGGFVAPVRVTFGDVPAQVLETTASLIRVRTPQVSLPAGETLTVPVTVTRDVGGTEQADASLPNAFTFARGGTIGVQVFSVTPATGPNEGGTRVRVRGDGFQAPVQVLFAGDVQVEASVESVSGTEIVAITPAATGFGQSLQNQAVDIVVRNVETGSQARLEDAFRYGVDVIITSLAPTRGPIDGGQRVTIFGQGFDEPVAVEFGGFAQQVISVTGTEIIARSVSIPVNDCADVEGEVGVTNIETGLSGTGPNYVYDVVGSTPTLGGLSPSSGTSAGNTQVTITGTNLGNAKVEFGGRTASVVSQSDTQIVVRTPPLPNSELETEDCSDAQGGTGQRYLQTAVDVLLVNQRTTCEEEFAQAFIYEPADGSCRITTPPEPPETPDPPTAAFTPVVNGLSVTFDNDSTCTGSCSYSWNFGDGSTSNAQSPTHVYGAAGTYTVSLTVANEGGSDSAAQNVTVP